MNVTITNINHETLNALEILLKPFILKDKMQIIKEDEATQAIKEYEDEKAKGLTKTYNNLDEYKKAMGV
ncbi:MAG: hypothetical protein CR967_05250 [Proteobacteria bacterium]|nr:MAG: hypothetical protein CR967_05250 [Pseudomonadota bacterium]